jgi:hypothetical protein
MISSDFGCGFKPRGFAREAGATGEILLQIRANR